MVCLHCSGLQQVKSHPSSQEQDHYCIICRIIQSFIQSAEVIAMFKCHISNFKTPRDNRSLSLPTYPVIKGGKILFGQMSNILLKVSL